KINGGMIYNLPNDPGDQHIVKAIVDMAHGLGKKVIAGFVNDEETMQMLKNYGVDYVQGYYIGMPAETMEYRTVR
ncbi:MAG: EAL domain-containing protein, partial [Candidatus Loosdrechtia sp.]|uniref:EAL domain-containing protein n=1 Tax=Candidatus Loosdrechtia sp. TaxID=3101272 RepID=UPI00403A8664